MRLCGILEHEQTLRFRKFTNGRHVGKPAIKMHHQNGTGPFGTGPLQQGHIQVTSFPVRIHKHGNKPRGTHGEHSRDKRIRRDNHFVPALQVTKFNRCTKHQGQRIKPVTRSYTMLRHTIFSKGTFKTLATGPPDKPVRIEHAPKSRQQVTAERFGHIIQRIERNLFRNQLSPLINVMREAAKNGYLRFSKISNTNQTLFASTSRTKSSYS